MVKLLLVSLGWITLLAGCTAAAQQCGVPKQKANHLIVRGSNANPQNWPWHAIIMHKKPALEYACGGTLIHKRYVVTAKHCLQSDGTTYLLSPGEVRVQLGVKELYEMYDQQHMVREIHVVEGDSDLHNDIAIVELRTSVQFNDHVLPACLIDRRMSPGEVGTVIGFGLTENGKVSTVLKMATMPVIETGKCLRADRTGFGELLDEGLFCAGFLNGTAVCNGDSGGGFFVEMGSVWYLAGVVSFSLESESEVDRCRQDSYGAFTRVWLYSEWIRQTTGLQVITSKNNLLPHNCGLNTNASNHPWYALVFGWRNGSLDELGAGSIISERYVLVGGGASWTTLGSIDSFRIVVGKYAANFRLFETDWKSITYHRATKRDSLLIKHNALSLELFRLEEKIEFNDFIQPICLPIASELHVAERKQFDVWFKATYFNGTVISVLYNSTSSTLVDASKCLAVFGRPAPDRQLCAQDPALHWNIAAITFQHHDGRTVLAGFRNDLDIKSKLMVIRKVEFHLDWILEHMKP